MLAPHADLRAAAPPSLAPPESDTNLTPDLLAGMIFSDWNDTTRRPELLVDRRPTWRECYDGCLLVADVGDTCYRFSFVAGAPGNNCYVFLSNTTAVGGPPQLVPHKNATSAYNPVVPVLGEGGTVAFSSCL